MTKFLIVPAAAMALAGCGGQAATQPAAAKTAATAVKIVEMAESEFAPRSLDVKVGETVRFVNRDEIAHTATAEGAFDTGTLQGGAKTTVTPTKPGAVTSVCIFHPGMTGTLNVR